MMQFETMEGVALPIAQPNFDTDQIIPARFLSRSREDGFADCLFRDLRARADGTEIPDFILNREEYRPSTIVVGERNFGCGSSREHAVWALADYGVRAVIAPSFGDIFYSNSLKNGLLPIRLPADVVGSLLEQLQDDPGAKVEVNLADQDVRFPDGSTYSFVIDAFSKECLLKGLDEIDFTLSVTEQISAFENRYGKENI